MKRKSNGYHALAERKLTNAPEKYRHSGRENCSRDSPREAP